MRKHILKLLCAGLIGLASTYALVTMVTEDLSESSTGVESASPSIQKRIGQISKFAMGKAKDLYEKNLSFAENLIGNIQPANMTGVDEQAPVDYQPPASPHDNAKGNGPDGGGGSRGSDDDEDDEENPPPPPPPGNENGGGDNGSGGDTGGSGGGGSGGGGSGGGGSGGGGSGGGSSGGGSGSGGSGSGNNGNGNGDGNNGNGDGNNGNGDGNNGNGDGNNGNGDGNNGNGDGNNGNGDGNGNGNGNGDGDNGNGDGNGDTGYTPDFEATYDSKEQKVKLIDKANGALIISPDDIGKGNDHNPDRDTKKVYDTAWSHDCMNPISPTDIIFESKPNGYDITVTLVNTGPAARCIGAFFAANIPFLNGDQDGAVAYRSFNYLFKQDQELPAKTSGNNKYFQTGTDFYPSTNVYSPAIVARGKIASADGGSREYSVGVAMQYPVLEYRHDFAIGLEAVLNHYRVSMSPNPKKGRYNPNFNLQPYDADNPTGHIRTYKFTVRVMADPTEAEKKEKNAWLRLLEPYREFFQKKYGAVRYLRNPTPVSGYGYAQTSYLDAKTNPHGFFPNLRPDENGFGPIVNQLQMMTKPLDQGGYGWNRSMMWSPSGLNLLLETNYRFEMLSHIENIQASDGSHRMRDTLNLLTDYTQNKSGFGFWWGRSTEVTLGGWNSSAYTLYDPHDLTLREASFKEVGLAHEYGARWIGLDQFAQRGALGMEIIEDWQVHYPEIHFVGESMQPDIMHVVAGAFMQSNKLKGEYAGSEQSFCANAPKKLQPLVLADFINPGHETWFYEDSQAINKNECDPEYQKWNGGWETNTKSIKNFMEYAAKQGYVPLISASVGQKVDNTTFINIAKTPSYTQTVPADLQKPYYAVITKQPDHASAACNNTVKLNLNAVSPRGNELLYQWYFYPRVDDPGSVVLPERISPETGLTSLIDPDDKSGNYAGMSTNEIIITVKKDTVGTYRALVKEKGVASGPTWSHHVRVKSTAADGDCAN
ncbi:MAG: hypothetical protein L6Q57_08070 [Alphaproteobacteria bacterium]|nr:hypothetical protein [Alphaproteobacteria bacterium]